MGDEQGDGTPMVAARTLLERADSPDSAPNQRVTPFTVHVFSLVAAAVLLVVTAQGSVHYWDDWPFLVTVADGGVDLSWLLQPHNEHLVLLPKLLYVLVHALVGTSSVWPTLVVVLALHLTLCHQLWRLAVRGGADAWLATVGAALFAVYVAGVDNIIWDFQLALVGSMVLGAATVLELSRPRPRSWLVAALTIGNVLTSGIALVFLPLTALYVVMQRRWLLLWPVGLGAAVWVAWYLSFAPTLQSEPGSGAGLLLPLWWVTALGADLAGVLPMRSPTDVVDTTVTLPAIGAAWVGAVVLGVVATSQLRHSRHTRDWTLFAFLLGALGFAALTGFGRVDFGLYTTHSPKYVYVGTAFLLPALLATLTRWAGTERRRVHFARWLVVALAVANVVLWPATAHHWIDRARGQAGVLGAGRELVATGAPILSGSVPADWFYGIPSDDLLLELPLLPPTEPEGLLAELGMQVRLDKAPAPERMVCGAPTTQFDIDLAAADEVLIDARTEGFALLSLEDGGATSDTKRTAVAPGTNVVTTVRDGGTLTVSSTDGTASIRLCRDPK